MYIVILNSGDGIGVESKDLALDICSDDGGGKVLSTDGYYYGLDGERDGLPAMSVRDAIDVRNSTYPGCPDRVPTDAKIIELSDLILSRIGLARGRRGSMSGDTVYWVEAEDGGDWVVRGPATVIDFRKVGGCYKYLVHDSKEQKDVYPGQIELTRVDARIRVNKMNEDFGNRGGQ